ncbi:MAG: DegT/DnrJ/EryC1/StrS family aminotransferase [Geothrix sp.]|uniref:GDP-perosamine synthase n=1 Tax=Candidatus Geothrix odensensis TaxID=2954440 RepID=A0A936EZZ0_9BACT|nr:DegT/DnrJ/EryC1/StrS family aminotransferase [Candidatus Geothrix odensensis]MBP7618708.1 DegT/DnrJ/EryC1/StrS family aminotransferase [Geothrix sp.]MCC6512553.1 DegT/DnrJ/EryC1/StrS family aminotransferase [Geothrix sp.]
MTHPHLPVAQPDLGGNELAYVSQAIQEGWISSTGRFLTRFEADFARFCGTRHALACANGTVAIHLLLLGLGIGPGDEVIVPAFTYVASANAVTYTGARPVLVDSEPVTWNIDANKVEAAITPRTKAIMAVHLYGHPAPMTALLDIGRRHGILVIEDAAEAHGAKVEGKTVGGLGLAATFSFYGNKILTTGEGGMVTTNDDELAARMRQFRGQGMDPERRYWFPIVGYNYRMTNLAAALGCAQLERAGGLIAHRLRIARGYHDRLAPHADRLGLQLASEAPWASSVHWLSCIRVPAAKRDSLMAFLAEHQIETRPFFPPMHRLPMYSDPSFRQGRPLPVAEELGDTGINLPTYTALGEADLDRICQAVIAGLAR